MELVHKLKLETKLLSMKNKVRYIAVEVLEKISSGAYSNITLNNAIKESNLNTKDVNLLTEIVYGVLQHQLTLDFYLKKYLQKPQDTPQWIIILLKTAFFQMKYLDRVPNFAIFNETIEIAKYRGNDGTRKLVTGILHKFQRDGKPDFNKIKNPVQRLSIEYSVAEWIVDQLIYELGFEKCESILKSINKPAKLSVRINPTQIDKNSIIEELESSYQVKQSKVAPEGLILTKGGSVVDNIAYINGDVTVQDESAMLVAESMQLKPGQKVLDACAAPGGKTTQIAQIIGPKGQVTAWDIYEHRVKLIQQNAKRMRLNNINAQIHNACDKIDEKNLFDRILIDAPCSGIGLLRRKPETRYIKSKKDSSDLHKIQVAILDNVSQFVKEDGILTYSTCTMLRKENQDTVQSFLANHPNFTLIKTKTSNNLKASRVDKTLNIYPDDFGSDGFFIANFKKVK